MKGRPKSVVIRRQVLPKATSTYTNQPSSSLSRRSIVSPHYKKQRLVQTEPTKNDKNSVSPHFHSVIKDPKLEALRESVEESGSFEDIDDDELTLLLAHTREYQQTCAAERKYEKANDAKELTDRIKTEMKKRQGSIIPDEEAIKAAEKKKKKVIEHYEKIFKDIEEETEIRQQKIEETQNKESEVFEDKWRNLIPRKYQKSSASLLQLKEIEKNLILTGDYLKAKEARERINQITKAEIELRQMDLNEDYAIAKAELNKKQKNEIDVFLQSRQEQIDAFDIKRKNDLQTMENRMNVASQKSIGTRVPRSTNKSSTDNYATSFQHIAKEKNFGIDPLLPKLGPPSDKRQYKIKNAKPKRIVVNAPRAYLPKNDKFFDSSDDQNSVFETQLKHSQLKGTEDEYDNDNEIEDEQRDKLQDQIEEISKSMINNNINDDNQNSNNQKSDTAESDDDKGILGNMFSGVTNDLTKDSGRKENDEDVKVESDIKIDNDTKVENDKKEENEEKEEVKKVESPPFQLLISSIVGDLGKKEDEKKDDEKKDDEKKND